MAGNLHDNAESGNVYAQVDEALAQVKRCIRALRDAEGALQVALSAQDGNGSRGCTWDKKNNSWKVRASVNGRMVNIGSFRRLADAQAAYRRAKRKPACD